MKSFIVPFTLLILVFLAACGGKTANSAETQKQENYKPSLDLKWEVSGNTLIVDVITDLSISEDHYGEARKAGEGHIHMYLDNGEKIGVKAPHKEFPDLAPGSHTLKISLHNNDHTPYDVTKTIDFTIE